MGPPPVDVAILARIQSSLEEALGAIRELVDSGPFRLYLDRDSDFPWMNYGFPVSGGVDAASIVGLVRDFQARGRLPRLEFFEDLWPEVSGLLDASGFECERRIPAMLCTESSFRPRENPELRIEVVSAESDLDTYYQVVHEAFEAPDPPDPSVVESVRKGIAQGNMRCAAATLDGKMIAAGAIVGAGEVAELAGIGTLHAYRRQAAASSVSSALMRQHFERGKLVWLSAGDDTSRAVYERLGFRVVGTQANYSLPS